MAVNWTLNGTPLATLGLSLVAGNFRLQGVSAMTLQRACKFDAAEVFAAGATVTLARNGTPYFTGKIRSIPKHGSGSEEGHAYLLEDAWAELETTVYQEVWAVGSGSFLLPRAILGLGLNTGGTAYERITVGKQLRNIFEYAIGQGVSLQLGSFPTGETMIPSEVSNVFCAELVQSVLRLHPDWIPWIDHSTSPPTINVTAVTAMGAVTFPVDGSGDVEDFECEKRDDLLPSGVRIVYEFATTIDDEVYRDVRIDKYPAGAPDGGPKLIQATIPLAGMSMQIQKSQVQTRALPPSNLSDARTYLRKKFPCLVDVADGHFAVTEWTPTVVADDEDHAPQISAQAARLQATTLAHMPRELVRGNVAEWMRRKVGRVHIQMAISASEDATEADTAALAKLPSGFTVTGTNAITKTYKGISQWVAPEEVPTGVAQAVYEAILNGILYQGSVTLTAEDLPATRYHGTKVNLSGSGVSAWATMGAAVHSVDWDVESGQLRLGFGPAPHLAPADFIELQRILRFRPSTWWSIEERISNRLGADDSPSARGDTVLPYDIPETILDAASGTGNTGGDFCQIIDVEGGKALRGGPVNVGDRHFVVPDQLLDLEASGTWLVYLSVDAEANRDNAGELILGEVKTSAMETLEMDKIAYTDGTNYPDSTPPSVSDGLGTEIVPLGKLIIADGVPKIRATGCGEITVGQCDGTWDHRRG